MQRNSHSCLKFEFDKCVFEKKTLLRWLALTESLHSNLFYIKKKIASVNLNKTLSLKTLPKWQAKCLHAVSC